MKRTGFYIVKDEFFADMQEPYLKGNKEENRPHYYCFEDSVTGIYWLIPLSTRIEKYRKIVEKKKREGKPCDIICIAKLDNGVENAFLIQDMFPITEAYVEREYTVAGNPLTLTSERVAREVEQKARKVLGDGKDLPSGRSFLFCLGLTATTLFPPPRHARTSVLSLC